MPLGFQHILQGDIVLDDAVVNDHDVARAVAVRVGISFVDLAVRRPACMADPAMAFQGVVLQHDAQVAQLTGGPTPFVSDVNIETVTIFKL